MILSLHHEVSADDFTRAGEASGQVKRKLKQLGIDPEIVRRVSIALYEGEINMVIHAGGGEIDTYVDENCITMVLKDHGPGIVNVDKAMEAGFSTANENIRSLGFGAGMGLPNMKKYSDEMHIETKVNEGTTITMKIHFDK